jgi:hypothetical protein
MKPVIGCINMLYELYNIISLFAMHRDSRRLFNMRVCKKIGLTGILATVQ